ncbi:MAG TPA: DUF6011 domain-containing protein [Acidimicrobiales bacterium]|nr:DUF6011 domain-containing protein [Acidimicrobiales bacterium]
MGLSSDPGTEPVLGEGHYTVVLASAGHRTLEVTRAGPDFRAGPFIVSYLCGPDNERDYRAFAHITAAGDGRLWHRFREDSALAAALAALVADPNGAAGAYRRGLRCLRCRRRLTHPDSIERGMGPSCARVELTTAALAASEPQAVTRSPSALRSEADLARSVMAASSSADSAPSATTLNTPWPPRRTSISSPS